MYLTDPYRVSQWAGVRCRELRRRRSSAAGDRSSTDDGGAPDPHGDRRKSKGGAAIIRGAASSLSPCKPNDEAGGGIRTHDRLITNQVLYQLSYASDDLPVRSSGTCVSNRRP